MNMLEEIIQQTEQGVYRLAADESAEVIQITGHSY
jgi:hypothetical protein